MILASQSPPGWFGQKEIPDKYQFSVDYLSEDRLLTKRLTRTLPNKYHCLMNDAYWDNFPKQSQYLYDELLMYATTLLTKENIPTGHFNRIVLIDYDKYNKHL